MSEQYEITFINGLDNQEWNKMDKSTLIFWKDKIARHYNIVNKRLERMNNNNNIRGDKIDKEDRIKSIEYLKEYRQRLLNNLIKIFNLF